MGEKMGIPGKSMDDVAGRRETDTHKRQQAERSTGNSDSSARDRAREQAQRDYKK